MNEDERGRAALVRAFAGMGAPPAQAAVMAAQLLKRAGQLARERGTSEEAALAELLEKIAAGRRGEFHGDGGAGGSSAAASG